MSSSTEPQSHPHDVHGDPILPPIKTAESIEAVAGRSVEELLKCPECGSKRLFRDGWRKLADGFKVQRYLCRECGYRFTEPSSKHGKIHRVQVLNRPNGLLKVVDEDLGTAGSRSDMGGGLVMEKPLRTHKRPAGGTISQEVLASFGLWLLKQGLMNKTAEDYVEYLRSLIKYGAELSDPESVKEVVAKMPLKRSSKTAMVVAYDRFVKFIGKSWERPKYRAEEHMPFIPMEGELDALIAGCGKKTATLLQLLKETGCRIGEAVRLKWSDVDFERRVIHITPEKGSKARVLPISNNLVAMLKNLLITTGTTEEDEIIFSSKDSAISNFRIQRRRLAKKLNNPRLKKITFHTFRHWKATMEYHKTKDIIHVKELLGHKKIENTMVYISIEKSLFQTSNDEFHARIAKSDEEALKLVETGFEYVCKLDSGWLFRKRK